MTPHPFTTCQRCNAENAVQYHIGVMGDCERVCRQCLTEDELFILSCGPKG